MDTAALLDVVRVCAVQVDPRTALALIRVESDFNPWAIGVVGGALVRQPRSRAEALSTARALRASGWDFSVGLAQIHVRNFARLGLTLEEAFDPCHNLRAMQSVLTACFARARAPPRAPSGAPQPEQVALRSAVSCYYSGSFTVGYRQGYVRKFISAAAAQAAAAGLAHPASTAKAAP